MKRTKHALLLSAVSMLLCLSMLVGSTFAWFTDTASTGVNKIVAGNLDIELSYKNANDLNWEAVTENTTDLFVKKLAEGETDESMLWEPGAVSVAYFKLENKGSLALEYQLKVSYEDTVKYGEVKLSDALKSAVVELNVAEGETEPTYFADRAAAVAAVEAENATEALGYTVEVKDVHAGATKYFAIVVYMPTGVDNTYNLPTGQRPLEIQLGVDLVATQTPCENDSFGNTYDEFAEYPNFPERIYVAETLPYTSNEIKVEDYEKGYWITIPEGAITPAESNPNPTNVTVAFNSEAGTNAVTYTFSITDEKGNALTLNKAATIRTYLGLGLENVASENVTVNYIENNGQIVMTPSASGSYVVTYSNPNVTTVSTADEFVAAFAALATKPGQTISLAADIDMSGANWTGVDNLSFTLLGNGHKISNITNSTGAKDEHGETARVGGLVNTLGAGNSVIIKNVTLENVTVSGANFAGGAVVGVADAAREITLENVTVTNATVNSSNYAGGLIGWNSGYGNTSDGAVYSLYTIKNCVVNGNSTITGGGSAGGAVGHAGASNFTTNTIDNFQMTNSTVNGETGRTDKSGLIVGTANIGDVVISNCEASDFSGNTVLNASNNTTIVGRLATSGGHGTLTINGTKYNADQTGFTLQ